MSSFLQRHWAYLRWIYFLIHAGVRDNESVDSLASIAPAAGTIATLVQNTRTYGACSRISEFAIFFYSSRKGSNRKCSSRKGRLRGRIRRICNWNDNHLDIATFTGGDGAYLDLPECQDDVFFLLFAELDYTANFDCMLNQNPSRTSWDITSDVVTIAGVA